MSRHRRGVVHSDDESTVPRPSKRARQSNPRNDQPIDDTILNLPNVTKLPPDQVAKIRLLENDGHTLKQRILQAMVVISDAAVAVQELDKTEHDEDVESLEKTLLRLIDASLHVDHATESYDRTCKASETSADAIPLHETFLAETRAQDDEYQEKSLEDKYGNITEFKDFKRRLWDVQHPNEPAPETWFTDPLATILPEDDDIVLDQEIQSLKCPLTLQLLEKPMRNTKCPHVYSLDAIRELVRHGGGQCLCPVSGCEAVITMAGIREDKVMARKVREEKAREEERFGNEGREVQDLNEGMSEVIYDDDDVKVERR